MKKYILLLILFLIPSVTNALTITGWGSSRSEFSSLSVDKLDDQDRYPLLKAFNADTGQYLSASSLITGVLDVSGIPNGTNVSVLHVEGTDWVGVSSGAWKGVYRNSDACAGVFNLADCILAIDQAQNINFGGGMYSFMRSPIFTAKFVSSVNSDLTASVDTLPTSIQFGLFTVLGWAFGVVLIMLFILKLVYRIK